MVTEATLDCPAGCVAVNKRCAFCPRCSVCGLQFNSVYVDHNAVTLCVHCAGEWREKTTMKLRTYSDAELLDEYHKHRGES
jgi:hypothetical protein